MNTLFLVSNQNKYYEGGQNSYFETEAEAREFFESDEISGAEYASLVEVTFPFELDAPLTIQQVIQLLDNDCLGEERIIERF